jgi:hypothetical protein
LSPISNQIPMETTAQGEKSAPRDPIIPIIHHFLWLLPGKRP